MMYASTAVPSGFLVCDGASYLRTTYAALFAIIGTTFGSADGTHFNVPDMRGEFARGFDNGRGVDPSRTFGTTQADQMQGHVHAPADGTSFLTIHPGSANGTTGGGNYALDTATGVPISDGTNGTPRTGLETRPTNVAMNFIIKT
jgi:microcystin-dependent protein